MGLVTNKMEGKEEKKKKIIIITSEIFVHKALHGALCHVRFTFESYVIGVYLLLLPLHYLFNKIVKEKEKRKKKKKKDKKRHCVKKSTSDLCI